MTQTEPIFETTSEAGSGGMGTMTGLITGIIDDGKTLLRQQMEMFKSELREDMSRSTQAAQYGALGIVFATVGALGFITALVYLLHEQLHLSMWISWGIMGLVFCAGAVGFGLMSNRLIKKFNPLPDKTLNAIKENLTWNKPN